MEITDKEVLRQLKLVRCSELEELLDSYPESERDGRSDMQVLADEAGYLLEMYNEAGTDRNEILKEAKWILHETLHGKVIPLVGPHLNPKYSKKKIDACKEIIKEYRRLGNLVKRLVVMGY